MTRDTSDETRDNTLATFLAEGGRFSAAELLRNIAELAESAHDLHASGTLHRAISLETVRVDAEARQFTLSPTSDQTCRFGGEYRDRSCCPPELRGSTAVDVPPDLTSARRTLASADLSIDPVRIDVYQLSTLLCCLAADAPVESYLRSPRTKAKVDVTLRPLIEHHACSGRR